MRAGIQPGHAPAQHLYLQLAFIQVAPVNVRDFNFAAWGGFQLLRIANDVVVLEVNARHGKV